MGIFFNPNDSADVDLLHPDVRNHPELSNQADIIEFEVIEYYKQRDMQGLATYQDFFTYDLGQSPTTEIKVRLVGYNEDDPADSEAGLKEALRRTIAGVLSYTLRNYDNTPNIASQSQGNRSISYSDGSTQSWESWQRGWSLLMKNYDAKIKPYGI